MPVPPRGRWLTPKRLLIAFAILVALAGLLLLGGLAYLRSENFNHLVVDQIQKTLKEYGLHGEIGGTEISLRHQTARLKDFKIFNERTGQPIATLKRAELIAEIREPYAFRLSREIVLKKVNLDGIDLSVEIDEQGRSNFEGLRTPPPVERRFTVDFSQFLATISGGAIHLKDRSHKVEADLTGINATAQPQSEDPNRIGLRLNASGGWASYEGRETKIERIDLLARVSESSAEVEQLNLNSGLVEANVKGRLDDWKALRYGFDFQSHVRLQELGRLFLPDVAMEGVAAGNGRVEGEGGHYRIKGDLDAGELVAAGTRLRDMRITQFDAVAKEGSLNFTSNQLRAQSVTIETVRVEGVAIDDLRGEYKNSRTHATAPRASVGNVAWPQSKLSSLALNNIEISLVSTERDLQYEVKTGARLNEGTISDVKFNQATARAIFNNTALTLNEIKANLLGGHAEGDFTLPLARGAASKAKANFTDLETKQFFSLVATKGEQRDQIPLSGKVSGEAEISLIGARAETIDGTIKVHFTGSASEAPQAVDAIPVTGDAAITAQNGVFNFDQLQLSTDASKLIATGSLTSDSDSDLRIKLTSTRAEELLQIARSIDAARPYLADYEPQLIGDFAFDGRISGKLQEPVIDGEVNAATVGLRDGILGSLTGHLFVSSTEVRVENGLISAPNGGSVKFSLATPLEEKAESGKLDAVIDRMSLETLLAAAGSPDSSQFVTGDITGEAHLSGLPASMNGTANINLINGKIADQPADVATASLKFEGKTALLEKVEIRLPQSNFTASGQMDLGDYSFKAQGKASQITLDSLGQAFELKDTRIDGTADADFTIAGKVITGKEPGLDWESLQVNLLAIVQNVRVNGRELGALNLDAKTSAGGRIDFRLETNLLSNTKTPSTPNKPEILRGSIELQKAGRPLTIESDLAELSLAPVLGIVAPELADTVKASITGKLRIEGPTVDESGKFTMERLSGGLTLTGITLEIANNPIKVDTPVTVALEAMQIKVNNTRFSGEGVDLSFGGTFGLRGDAGMNFSLKGTVNLNQMPPVADNWLLNGTVSIDTKLTGTADTPNLTGKIDLNGFGLSSDDLPVFIADGVGSFTLSGDELRLDSFKANANDGALEITGRTKLEKLRPTQWKYNITINDATVDYQEINATIDGNITLEGTPQGQLLSGMITVPQAEYTPGFDLDNLLSSGNKGLSFGSFGRPGGGTQPKGIPPTELNVRVEARDSFIARNEQINAAGSALLTISGTLNDPDVTGRIETDGGTVRFRGQRYEITSGSIDLPPGGGDPQINLQAEGEVSGYRLTIGFVGPAGEIDLTLRSEPLLSRDEIIALITTGKTEAGSLTGQDMLYSGVGAAASLITSGLISRPTEQLFGLSRFQIDPVIRPDSNPAARLTIGQQLSRNFYLSYSTNLASEQDQTALAEYAITSRFSALATYTQGGSPSRQGTTGDDFTIELRGRKRFSLGFVPPEPASSGSASTQTESISRIARPQLLSADVQVSQVQDLKLSDRKLRELLPVMNQGFSRSLARLGERRLREYLQERGYFFAEVHYRCEPVNCTPSKPDSGLSVFYDVQPNTVYDLKEIRIEGTQQVKLRDISGQLQSQKASIVGGVPFLQNLPLIGGYVRGLTSSDRLRSDEETIRRRLLDIGFRNARVQSRLAVKPEDDNLIVIFQVDEGIQSDIAGISPRGNTVLSSEVLVEAVPIKAGEAFSFTRSDAGTQQIKRRYAEEGFLDTQVELEFIDTDEDSVLLVYNINEGPRTIVSEIEIKGLTKTDKDRVRQFLAFKEGDVLTPAKINQTQRELYASQAFREVTVRTEKIGGEDPSAHRVTLNLTEAKPLLMVYGLGYSTDDGPRGLMEISYTNFRGALNTLSLRMRGSGREQFAQLSYTDLRPWGWKLPTTVSIFYNRNTNLRPFFRRRVLNEDGSVQDDEAGQGFGFQRFAAFIQTERKVGERTSLRFRYNLERTTLIGIDPKEFPDTDVTRLERAIRLGMFSAGFTHDTRDSIINPTRGHLFSADHSIAAHFFGGNESFNKFFGTYQAYKTLDSDFPLLGRSTLAFSARIGLAAMFRFSNRDDNPEIDESEMMLPISERFFSGGATTLRGFRFDRAGPQDILEPRQDFRCDAVPPVRPCDLPTLVPTGGDALTIFNFELRYPLTQRLRLVPFYDLGNVFRHVHDINWSNMTHTVGMGLRINTPLGPVGVDYGFMIDPPFYITRDGAALRQPRGALHIRFGQSF
jgi:outer membrane protein assembly complex protein YaeT